MFCAERRYYGHPWNRRSPVGKGWSGSLVGVLATISLICACAAIIDQLYPLTWIWAASAVTVYQSPDGAGRETVDLA